MEAIPHVLEQVARQRYGLHPIRSLPIGESFSASVFRFLDRDGHQYVLKRHRTVQKARQEISAIRRLAHLEFVPRLLDANEADDHGELLLSGFDALPWQNPIGGSPALLRSLGEAMRRLHMVSEESFGGCSAWHGLLCANTDRYVAVLKERGSEAEYARVGRARELLRKRLVDVPSSSEAVLIHLDLRPGNILVRDGAFVAIIDFEAARGGHPSMDLFKLWRPVLSRSPAALAWFLEGYGAAPWLELHAVVSLMSIYGIYHGIAGLAWCAKRGELDSAFGHLNRSQVDALMLSQDWRSQAP